MPVLSAGKAAPPFELAGVDGEKYSLKDSLSRGPVVVAFFKVECPVCQYTFPFLERIYQQLRSRGAQVWGVVQDEAREARSFAKEFGVSFPILVDDHPYALSREYGLKYVPTVFLIEPDGSIAVSSEGFAKSDLVEIHKSLAQSLSASPAPLFKPTEKIPEYKPG
jgi:peroxiredoxin